MKASLSRMLRSGIAMLIVLCMVASVVPAAVFAADDAKKQEVLDKLETNLDRAEAGINELYDLIITYGPEVAMGVWTRWEESGYIDAVNARINVLKEKALVRLEHYKGIALEINKELMSLEDEKDALVAELEILNAQLEAKKAELAEVIAKQEIGSVTAPDFDIDVELGNNTQTTVPGNDCTVGDESVKTELEKAIADLEHAIAVLEALIADISADIADFAALAAEIAETVASLGNSINDIVAVAQDLKAAFEDIAAVMADESAADIAEQFVVAVDKAYELVKAASGALELAEGAANDAIADAEKLINKVIDKKEVLLEMGLAGVIIALPTEEAQIQFINAFLAVYGKSPEEIKALVEAKLTELKNTDEYKQAEQDLKDLLDVIDDEIAIRYEAAKAEALAQIEALEAKKAELEGELKALYAELAATVDAATRGQLMAQIDRITGDLAIVDADLAHAVAHLDAALQIAYNEIVEEVKALYAEAVADLEAKLNELTGKTLAELLKLGTEGWAQILNALEELKAELAAKGEEALKALADKLVELFNQMLYGATHGEVLAGVDMKYVALGDGSNDFAAALAEMLKGKAPAAFEFVNAAKPGATAADVAANLPADVADANVITLGFSQTEIIGKAIAAYFAGENVDWAALLGEQAVPYVEEALEYVYEEIDARVADEQIAAVLKTLAEAYAYGAADYAINLPILIKNIREVNPTAEIVIVGMYNPIETLAISVPNIIDVDLSAYADVFNYLVDAVYGYGVALSVIAKDVTYVDAREVEIEKNTLGLTEVDALLKGDISALYPSANGDAYIAEQINSALTVKMLGDANDDGVVDSYDATLIARYDVGLIGANDLNLAVCDVNGDGVVDSYDATLVARYDVGLLAA